MSDLLKKSVAYAFAIISAVFTFIPEVIFGKVILISEDVLKQFTLDGLYFRNQYYCESCTYFCNCMVFHSVWI